MQISFWIVANSTSFHINPSLSPDGFLQAPTHVNRWLCPSVGWSVDWLVGRSVCWSVGAHAYKPNWPCLFFLCSLPLFILKGQRIDYRFHLFQTMQCFRYTRLWQDLIYEMRVCGHLKHSLFAFFSQSLMLGRVSILHIRMQFCWFLDASSAWY